MIYLDTHVVVWLYAGLEDKFSDKAITLINNETVQVSPIVILELQYLYEIKRINAKPQKIIDDLANKIGLMICDISFLSIINASKVVEWTRDPFDRIIVGNASLNKTILLTKDQFILDNYRYAKW